MSHKATNWAFSQRGLKPGPKLVLLCLADRHNPDMGCFPAQETLAEDAAVSRATLNRYLDELQALGLIHREARVNPRTKRQERTRYILGFELDFPQDADQPCPELRHGTEVEHKPEVESQSETRSVSQPETRPVSQNRPEPCLKIGESRVSNRDTNPVREPVREPHAHACAHARDGGVSEYDFGAFWAAYPNRVQRDAAERAWSDAVVAGANPARLIVKARRYAASDKVARGYAKTPANWLRDGDWRDPQPGDDPADSEPLFDRAAWWGERIANGRAPGAASAVSTALAREILDRRLATADQLKALGVAV